MQQTETQHITRSRISIPRRRTDLLTRQRLLDAMDELLDKKIILINAPAGYGKTSLLIDLADDLALPICWYALDTLDQNLPRFLEYLVAAIQVRFPDFNTSLINVLRSSTQKEISIDTAVSILSNDIYDQITEHFIIMLDDYHLINDDPQVNQFLSQFIQQTEENCHIIFASRSLLALPDLPLLVARGLVGGLDQFDLAFNSHETRDLFFFQHHIVLSDDEAEVLQKQTEGWVTGLLLTARTAITRLIPKQKDLRATGVNINDYFDLIYNAQSETIRQFLLYTSLLEDFSPSLFANTIGKQFPHLQEQYQDCVDHILTSNLFVQSIQMEELSLRYHHLFLDYLQNKFKLEENELYLELQILIAGYYEETQQWEQAYQIYEQEGMLDRQVLLIKLANVQMLFSSNTKTLLKWISGLPHKIVDDNPMLSSIMGAILCQNDQLIDGLYYLNEALRLIDKKNNIELYVRTMARKALILRLLGKYQESLNIANFTIEFTENNPQLIEIHAEINRTIGTCYFEMGELRKSNEHYKIALDIFEKLEKKDEIALTKLDFSCTYAEQDNSDEAEKLLGDSISYYIKINNFYALANSYNNLGVIQHNCGQIEDAQKSLQLALSYSRLIRYTRMENTSLCSLGDLYSDLKLYKEAEKLYEASLHSSRTIQSVNIVFYNLFSLSRINIYQNRISNAEKLLAQADLELENNFSDFHANLIKLVKAQLLFAKNDLFSSLDLLNEAKLFFLKNNFYHFYCQSILYTLIIYGTLHRKNECKNEILALKKYISNSNSEFRMLTISELFFNRIIDINSSLEKETQINEWIHQLKNFRNRNKILQSLIKSNIVETNRSQPHLQITTLGSMRVKYKNKTLTTSDWQTQSARDFFFLVLSNPAGFTKEEIGLLLWPDDTLQEFRYHFRNAIYRVRHAIGKESILLEGDIYRFNNDQDFILDAQEFEQEVQAFLDAGTVEDKQKHYKRANKLYIGPYLPGLDLEIIRLERERLQTLYRQITLEMCQFSFDQEDFQQTIELANQALVQDTCNEEICRLAMKAQSALGNRAEIARLYQRCEEALLEEYDAQPSEQTRKLYKILMRI